MPTRREFARTAVAAGLGAGLCSKSDCWLATAAETPQWWLSPGRSLRECARERGLYFGAAVDPDRLDVEGLAAGRSRDGYTTLVNAEAGMVVAENAMKWKALRPTPSTFDFTAADQLMRFAALAGQQVRGHNLCWHQALPDWFRETASGVNARQLLVDHIRTVAGRYRGRIHSWDVVNEAIEPADGRPDALRHSPWLTLLGPEYIEIAFRAAAEADPLARLTYNDYGIEAESPEQNVKRGQVLLLLRRLKVRGVPLHAVGIQGHLLAGGPAFGPGLVNFIREAARMGLEVYITELDVNTRAVPGGAAEQDAAVASLYRSFLSQVLAEPNVPLVLIWGLTSAFSWLNDPGESWGHRPDGSRQRPLPFDDRLEPTPTFQAIEQAIRLAHPPTVTPAAAPEPNDGEDPNLFQPFAVKGSPAPASPNSER